MTEEKKLQPVRCGCGGEAYAFKLAEGSYQFHPWMVMCQECGMEISERQTEEEAVADWNRAMGGTKWFSIRRYWPMEEGQYLTYCRYRNGSAAMKIKLWKDSRFTSENENVMYWKYLPVEPEEKAE